MLNDRLPKSQFAENGKKTVNFIDKQLRPNSSFKIKTKKFRSEKTIMLPSEGSQKQIKDNDRNIPKLTANRSIKQLAPIERDLHKRPKQ